MTLILYPEQDDTFFFDQIKKSDLPNIELVPIYYPQNLIFRIIRKVHMKVFSKYHSIWYQKWKNNKKKDVKKIILFDSILSFEIINDLKKMYPYAKIIFWFWNPIKSIDCLKKIKIKVDEVWTFDEFDAEKYNLKRNNQFYFDVSKIYKNYIKKSDEVDLYFIGADKGRLEKLIFFSEIATRLKLKIKFQVLKDRNKNYKENNQIEYLRNPIKYEEIIKNVLNSKCILEIYQLGQNGLTLRSLEAIFFQKKLITTNQKIKNYEFYNENNIYILTAENYSGIKSFLEKPLVPIEKEKKNKYLFQNWVKVFEEA